jgi:hypothetical protein
VVSGRTTPFQPSWAAAVRASSSTLAGSSIGGTTRLGIDRLRFAPPATVERSVF